MKPKYVYTSPDGVYGNGSKITVRKIILSAQPDTKGECAIKVEVMRFATTGDKNYKRLNTGVRCKAVNWDKKKEEVKSKDFQSSDKNVTIEKLYTKIKNHILTLKTHAYRKSQDAELQEIDKLFPNETREKKKTLIEYIDDYIAIRKDDDTPRGTLKEFTTCKNRLKALQEHNKRNLYFEDINMSFSDNLNSYMKNVMVMKNGVLEHKYKTGTINKTFTVLVTILYFFYERRDELKIDLSDKFTGKNFKRGSKSINDPHPISRAEFALLKKHKFDNASLEMTKQRFLFQCGTGIRYSDMFLITKANIIDYNTVNECIVYYPVKTIHKGDTDKERNKVIVPVRPMIKNILESVGYNMHNLSISNQKYNLSLTAMFKELNAKYDTIEFDIYSTHDGRDTFITYAIEAKIDIPTLLKIVGQSSYEVMSRYFKVTHELTIEKMKQLTEFK